MERIKEALERARKERHERGKPDAERSQARLPCVESIRIEYDRTRIIETPKKALSAKRCIAGRDEHEATAAYNILRTQVLRRMQSNGWNSLAITSPAPTEGKSLTAVNLAISIAQQFENTVLLVDLDLRRPSLASYFECGFGEGLTDHLLKGVPLHEVVFNPGIEHLVVLPAGFPLRKASELLRSQQMLALTKELKARYPDRYILYDLPPLLVGDDAISFLPYVECVLLVIEHGKTHPDQLARAANLVQEFQVIGSVLNKYTDAKTDTYYDYY